MANAIAAPPRAHPACPVTAGIPAELVGAAGAAPSVPVGWAESVVIGETGVGVSAGPAVITTGMYGSSLPVYVSVDGAACRAAPLAYVQTALVVPEMAQSM